MPTDTRPRVPLSGKTINLGQLADEVGADLTASDTEVVVADEDSTVTAEALQAALDAHVPATDPDEFRDAVDAAVADEPADSPLRRLAAALLADR